MSQQQKRPGAQSSPADGGKLKGNFTAKIAASQSREILNAPVQESVEDWLANVKLLPDHCGMFGGKPITEWDESTGKNKMPGILLGIREGFIDPNTMQWTDKAYATARRICICLVPACDIGPFIPFRK